MIDNYQIADCFSLLSKLMDIHGENNFKSKSYSSAAFNIEKLSVQLFTLPTDKIELLPAIGNSTAQKIIEILSTGKLSAFEEIIGKTPEGIIELLNIKGIGPKKINTIWKEMEIESVGELLYACKENRLKLYKGFGEKTQQNVIDSIEFYLKNKGSHLYAQVKMICEDVHSFLSKLFPTNRIEITGAFKRQLEIIDLLEFLIDLEINDVKSVLVKVDDFKIKEETESYVIFSTLVGVNVKIYSSSVNSFVENGIKYSSSQEFWNVLIAKSDQKEMIFNSEKDYFEKLGLPFIPPFLRENTDLLENPIKNILSDIIQPNEIKGIIHSHSNWSDGNNTIEEMAKACIQKGFEYLVISDHSKSAFYAQGLSVDKIFAQHDYINELNEKFAPFKIFKSIESDILNDGKLDYEDEVLAKFDLVIASVHSNLKMSEEKAMSRLLTAISNPFTTILGHMTGRLLLSRPGFPVNHKEIIDACAKYKVAIELNAHPSRLDIDWRHINYAIEKGALISINPDAHQIDGFDDIQYGVAVAQKAMVTKENNLSCFNLVQFENYLSQIRKLKSVE
jgi:DNA polymerase (family 10)